MLFNSFEFIGLFLVTFALYYFPRFSKMQIGILIASSLIFYAYYKPALLLLLLLSAGINILISYRVVFGQEKRKKLLATTGVACNLLILAFFKYGPLISLTLFEPESSIGDFLLTIPLPIGISFYTFEGISLVIDVFKGNEKERNRIAVPSLAKHAQQTLFFIAFFPHLIAGPILKAHDFFPQIGVKLFQNIDWKGCFKNLVLGYFLKLVIADNLKDFTYWISFPYFVNYDSITLVVLLFGYSFQIFADFAGYSLIAVGLARLLGYDLMNNFHFPYIATSFKDFWKRWHISLSSFLMEYLYFPLGGNRKGKFRTYLNLLITMILGGLWHGAAWSYAIWGAFHGMALAIERLLSEKIKVRSNPFTKTIKGITVFIFITLAWLLFKLPEFDHVLKYFSAISNNTSLYFDYTLCTYIAIYSTPVILYHGLHLLQNNHTRTMIKKSEIIIYGIMLFLIATNSGSSGAFIYFQF